MMTFHSKFQTVIKITLVMSNLSKAIQSALTPHISTHTVNQPALHVNQSVLIHFYLNLGKKHMILMPRYG